MTLWCLLKHLLPGLSDCLWLLLSQSTLGLSRGSCWIEKEETHDNTGSGEGNQESPELALWRDMGCGGASREPLGAPWYHEAVNSLSKPSLCVFVSPWVYTLLQQKGLSMTVW